MSGSCDYFSKLQKDQWQERALILEVHQHVP